MKHKSQIKVTVFAVLCILGFLGIAISSLIMINMNSMNARLQGWVNLLWLPLPVVILLIDRLCIRKFDIKSINRVQWYLVLILILVFILNIIRLLLQDF